MITSVVDSFIMRKVRKQTGRPSEFQEKAVQGQDLEKEDAERKN